MRVLVVSTRKRVPPDFIDRVRERTLRTEDLT